MKLRVLHKNLSQAYAVATFHNFSAGLPRSPEQVGYDAAKDSVNQYVTSWLLPPLATALVMVEAELGDVVSHVPDGGPLHTVCGAQYDNRPSFPLYLVTVGNEDQATCPRCRAMLKRRKDAIQS